MKDYTEQTAALMAYILSFGMLAFLVLVLGSCLLLGSNCYI